MRETFRRYVSPRLADKILQDAQLRDSLLSASDVRTHAVVLFADLRGFTGISEQLAPHEVVPLAEVRRQLELLGIPYRLSHRLVRGLDYYVRTTFEVTSDQLGSQSSVLGGGRYDGLVKDLGGPDLAGIGFAVGLERLALLLPPREGRGRCDVFLMPLAEGALDPALKLQRALRAAGVRGQLDPEGRSFKSRMKQADKLGARLVAILGADELARGAWTVRDMARSEQQQVENGRILDYLKEKTNG